MPHLFRNIGHRQEVLVGEIPEQKELSVGNAAFIELLRKVQQEATLREHDEVRELAGILPYGGF
ncbi:hypothetical protein D3C83_146320 [compost metagenome]